MGLAETGMSDKHVQSSLKRPTVTSESPPVDYVLAEFDIYTVVRIQADGILAYPKGAGPIRA